MKLKDDIFDAKVRAVLKDAEESVPEGLWAAIGERIPSRRRPVFAVVRWAVPIAAAAVIVLGVVLSTSHPSEPLIQPVSIESGRELAFSFDETETALEQEMLPAHQLKKESTAAAVVLSGDAVPQDVSRLLPDSARERTEQDADKPSHSPLPEQEKSSGYDRVDPFAALAFEDSRKSDSKVSLTFSYDAGSNSNPTNGGANKVARHYSRGAASSGSDAITETGDSRFGIPVSFGIGAKYLINERFSVGFGLDFTSLSRSFAGNYTRIGSDGTVLDRMVYSDIRNRQRYIGIPVNFFYSISSRKTVDMYVYAGGALEKCISNKYIMSSTAGNFTMKEKVKGLQASVNAGIGMEFFVLNNVGLFFDPSLRYYFDCNQPKSIRTQQPFMMGFEVGLRLRM